MVAADALLLLLFLVVFPHFVFLCSSSDDGDDLIDYLAEVDPDYYDRMSDKELDDVVRNYRTGVIFI
jgi:hypothetical protein